MIAVGYPRYRFVGISSRLTPNDFGWRRSVLSLLEKAAALGVSIIMNHPFVDGNKQTGHAGMETFLVLNGLEINASVNEQERIVLAIASGKQEREAFVEWLQQNTTAS